MSADTEQLVENYIESDSRRRAVREFLAAEMREWLYGPGVSPDLGGLTSYFKEYGSKWPERPDPPHEVREKARTIERLCNPDPPINYWLSCELLTFAVAGALK